VPGAFVAFKEIMRGRSFTLLADAQRVSTQRRGAIDIGIGIGIWIGMNFNAKAQTTKNVVWWCSLTHLFLVEIRCGCNGGGASIHGSAAITTFVHVLFVFFVAIGLVYLRASVFIPVSLDRSLLLANSWDPLPALGLAGVRCFRLLPTA
jgi:hypothetical protein